jgi:hypothetical protein
MLPSTSGSAGYTTAPGYAVVSVHPKYWHPGTMRGSSLSDENPAPAPQPAIEPPR